MSVNPSDKGLLTPENCAVILIDHQPQMFFGVASIDRQELLNNLTGFLQLAGSSFGAIKYWSGFASDFCSGTLECSANRASKSLAFLLL